MVFLSQHRFPTLWNAFQYTVGGTIDKRLLCLKHYRGEKRILEVGCSLGNISKAFVGFPDIRFTGVDIDPVVIDYAKKRFRAKPAFEFICRDLQILADEKQERYDYILLAGVCHHVDDQQCRELVTAASALLVKDGGSMVVVDPLIPKPEDSWFVHRFFTLEQGQHLRTEKQLIELLQGVEGLRIADREECLIGASPFHWPICARFGVYRLRRNIGDPRSAGAKGTAADKAVQEPL